MEVSPEPVAAWPLVIVPQQVSAATSGIWCMCEQRSRIIVQRNMPLRLTGERASQIR
jgi:hypothetical protein